MMIVSTYLVTSVSSLIWVKSLSTLVWLYHTIFTESFNVWLLSGYTQYTMFFYYPFEVFQTDFIQIVHMSEFYARKHNPLLENRLFRFGGE